MKTKAVKFSKATAVKMESVWLPEVTANGQPVANLKLGAFGTQDEALREAKIAAYDLTVKPWKFMSDGRGGNALGDRPEYRATVREVRLPNF